MSAPSLEIFQDLGQKTIWIEYTWLRTTSNTVSKKDNCRPQILYRLIEHYKIGIIGNGPVISRIALYL